MSWTEPRVVQLKRLAAAGLSAAQIAGELGDVSRNGVISKLSRIGVALTGSRRSGQKPGEALRRRVERSQPAIATPRQQTVVGEAIEAPEPRHLTLLDLGHRHCRWPFGDGPFTFCGHDGFPYCPAHVRAARSR